MTKTITESNKHKASGHLAHFFGYTVFLLGLALLMSLLLWHYVDGEYGYNAVQTLRQELRAQQQLNSEQAKKNARLRADVADLKTGLVAIEEHAREDLGWIKPGEIFVQLTDSAPLPYPVQSLKNETDAVEVLEPTTEERQ